MYGFSGLIRLAHKKLESRARFETSDIGKPIGPKSGIKLPSEEHVRSQVQRGRDNRSQWTDGLRAAVKSGRGFCSLLLFAKQPSCISS